MFFIKGFCSNRLFFLLVFFNTRFRKFSLFLYWLCFYLVCIHAVKIQFITTRFLWRFGFSYFFLRNLNLIPGFIFFIKDFFPTCSSSRHFFLLLFFNARFRSFSPFLNWLCFHIAFAFTFRIIV